MEKKNKTYLLITLGVLAVIVITLGVTYAYWRLTREQTNENVVTTACLDFEITNEQDDIHLEKTFPISDEEGYELTPYKFTIKNKCQDNATYQINLEMLEGSDLSTNYIKYVLNELKEKYVLEYKDDYDSYKDVYDTNEECQSELEYYQAEEYYTLTKECVKEKVEPSYDDYYYLDDFYGFNILGEEEDEDGYVLDNAIEGKKLTTGILGPEESKDFTLRLWMDEDVTIEDGAMNKTLLSKITVSTAYLDEEMVRPTADLALSVCENDITAVGSGEAKYDREISKYEYKIDSNEWQEGNAYQEFTEPGIGSHQVSVRVTDNQNSVSKEVTKEIEITNSEPETVEIAGMQVPIATCKNGLYKVEHNDLSELDSEWNKTEYRYAGVNYKDENSSYIHNYVLFNNEKWRIIGLVNVKTATGVEQRVKIIRTNGIDGQKDFGNYAWDRDNDYTNNWITSKLKNMLNGIYYESSNGECYIDTSGRVGDYPGSKSECDFSGNGNLPKGLDGTARQMIDSEVIWNIGGWDSTGVTADTMYEKERENNTYSDYSAEWTTANDETYHKGIGIMYPSDYGYAVGGEVRNTCLSNNLYAYDTNNCYKNDWLKEGSNPQWLLLPDSILDYVFGVDSDGRVSYGNVNYALVVAPVVYLTSSTTISDGDGSFDNPFRLQSAS